MKRYFFIFFLLIIFFEVKATHLIGGNLRYEFIGVQPNFDHRYKIIMNYFFNCDDEANDIFQNPTLNGFQNDPQLNTITIAIYGHDNPLNVIPDNVTFYPKWGEVTLDVTSVDVIDINNPSGCTIGSDICVYQVEYSAIVDLNNNNGIANGGFHVTHERCCRNNSIENISDPGGTGMTYYAWIPPIFSNNTSPEFTNSPLPFICMGDTTTALNTATDIDGDELIFSYVTPLKGNFTAANPPQNINPSDYPETYSIPISEVQYGPGYSYESPFGTGGYYNVVASNGLTTYYSNIQGKFVVGVLIKEYREVNGQILLYGVTTREVQLIVQNCPTNESPQINPFAGSTSSNFSVEEGDSICFDFGYYDPSNPSDLMTLTADGQIFDETIINPSATIQSPVSSNSSGQDTVNTRFCWDTDCGQYQNLPYIFSVSVVDQGCPPKTTNNVYEITVTPTNTPGNIFGEDIICQNSTAIYHTESNPSITYLWEVDNKGIIVEDFGDSIEILWNDPGTGVISLRAVNAHGCISSPITSNATITPSPVVDIEIPETICNGDSVELVGSTNANPGFSTLWISDGDISSPNNLTTFVSPSDTTKYFLTIDVGGACLGTDSVIVNVASIELDLGDDQTICIGDTATLSAISNASIFTWSPNSYIDQINNNTTSAWPITNTEYILEASTVDGCSNKDTINVFVNPLPGSNTDFVLNGSASELGNNEYLLTNSLDWDTGAVWNSTLVNLNQPFHFDVDLFFGNQDGGADGIAFGLQQISNQILTPGGGMGYEGISPSFFVEFDTYQNNLYNDISDDHIAVQINGNLDHSSANNLVAPQSIGNVENGQWYNCVFDWDPLNLKFTVTFNGTQIIDFNYNIVDNVFNGTSATYWGFTASTGGLNNEQKIRYNTLTFFNEIIDQRICENESILISAPVEADNYLWEPENSIVDNTTNSPSFEPEINTTYIFTATNLSGCSIRDTFEILVDELPIVFAGNDSSVCIGDTISLNANGNAENYEWSNGILNGEFFEINNDQNYVLTGTSLQGCTNRDTISLTALLIPNTYTGEEDGYINLCINDSVQLQGQGADIYSWSPDIYLSDVNDPNTWAKPISATEYVLTGELSNGCNSTDTLFIDVNPLPILSTGGNPLICQGDTVQIEAFGGNLYNWIITDSIENTSISNPQVWPIQTTTYLALVSDINTCEDTVEVTVFVNPLPNVFAGNDQNICIGDSTSIEASGALNYTWTPDLNILSTNESLTDVWPLVTTSYTVEGIDLNQCSNTDTVIINVLDLPSVDAGNDLEICIGDTTQFSASGAEDYIWSPNLFISNIDTPDPFVYPDSDIKYFVFGTDSNGCSNTDSIEVLINNLPSITISNDTSICIGDTINISAEGGSAFQWLNTEQISDVNIENPDIWPTSTSIYSVIVTNTNNCSDTSSVEISVNPLPNVFAGNDQNICVGDSTSIEASGALNYTWTPDLNILSTNESLTDVWPLVTTSYTVEGIDVNQCSNTDTVIINVLDLPSIDAGNDLWLCPGDSIKLNVNEASIYSWTPDSTLSNGFVQNPNAGPLVTCEYVITITDTNSCLNSDTIIVTVDSIVPTDAGQEILYVCEGNTIELGGSPTAPPSSIYQWSTNPVSEIDLLLDSINVSNPIAQPIAPTWFIVTTTNFVCNGKDSVYVTFHPPIVGSASENQQICFGDSIQINANGGENYNWHPVTNNFGDTIIINETSSGPIVFPDDTTVFQVTITDENNCSELYSTVINVNTLPNINLSADTSICIFDSLLLHAEDGEFYSWSPNYNISDTSIANPTVYNTINTTYYVTVTNSNNCINYDSININVDTLPNVNASANNNPICFGESTLLLGTGAVTYYWYPAENLTDSSTAFPIANPNVTTTFNLIGTDGNGCENHDSVLVNVLPLPNANAGVDDTICPETSTELNGSGGLDYVWLNPINLSNFLIPNPIATPDTITSYVVQVTAANGCINYDTVVIYLHEPANANAGFNSSICPDDSVILSGSGGIEYSWEPSEFVDLSENATTFAFPNENMNFVLEVTDSNGCVDFDTVQILVFNATTNNDTVICVGDTIQADIFGDPATNISWNPSTGISNTSIDNPYFYPESTTIYTVNIENAAGCQILDTFIIDVSTPLASFDTALNAGCNGIILSYINTSDENMTIEWMFSDGTSSNEEKIDKIFSFNEDYSATLSVTDIFGCESSTTISDKSLGFDDYFKITRPNVFTPDGDGKNDIFYIDVPGKIYECTDLTIYNRWGQIQFLSTGNNLRWDGRNNVGKIVPNGTYFYTLSVKNKLFKGSISIYR